MSNYTTPGVYVEEISTLPPSVAQVATAVPAFIGFTEKGPKNSPTRISSMLEFESTFGGASPTTFTVSLKADSTVDAITPSQLSNILYYSLRLFFANGGGVCYIVSVGHYSESKTEAAFSGGLDLLSKVDEPTLIVLSDAMSLGDVSYHTLCQQATAQCAKLKDRFTLIDIAENDHDGSAFRGRGLDNLSYAAAYTPHLLTSITYNPQDSDISVSSTGSSQAWTLQLTLSDGGVIDGSFTGNVTQTRIPRIKIVFATDNSTNVIFANSNNLLTITIPQHVAADPDNNVVEAGTTTSDIQSAWNALSASDQGGFSLAFSGNPSGMIQTVPQGNQNFTDPQTSKH